MEKIDELKEKFRKLLDKRIRSPLPSKKAELLGKLVPLTRHHIIPLNTLQAFAFTATDFYDDPELTKFLDRHFKSLLEQFRKIDLKDICPDLHLKHCKAKDPEEKILNLMVSIFQWLPGNIFYGPPPELRWDDPGPRFELCSAIIVGKYIFFENSKLNSSMRRFSRSCFITNHVELYIFIINGIDRLLKTATFEFNKDHWVEFEEKFRLKPIDIGLVKQSNIPNLNINSLQYLDPIKSLNLEGTKTLNSGRSEDVEENGYQNPFESLNLVVTGTFDTIQSGNSEDFEGEISCYALKLFEFLENNFITE